MKYLDYREKGGYKMAEMLFHPTDQYMKPYNVLVYLATKDNPNYLGPANVRDIADVDGHLKDIKSCLEEE